MGAGRDVREGVASGVVGERRNAERRHGHDGALELVARGGVAHRAGDHTGLRGPGGRHKLGCDGPKAQTD